MTYLEYFWALFFATFALEDAALAAAITLLAQHKISFGLAFFSCFCGIAVGDLGLYGLGVLLDRFETLRQISFLQKIQSYLLAKTKSNNFDFLIVISRFIPGSRLPIYLSAGFARYSFWRFTFLVLASVFVWVLFTVSTGGGLQRLWGSHWIMGLLVFFLILHELKKILTRLVDPWDRKTLLYSWRQWLSFEFWPPLLFYIPVIFYWIIFSLRGRSFLLPFYSNPRILNGGLVGESKFDFMKHLDPADTSTLRTIEILPEWSDDEALNQVLRNGIVFPMILKPDVGQRGFGVRIIRSPEEFKNYLSLRNGALTLAQQLSHLPHEAGIFYIRKPSQQHGLIFSITDKYFPAIVGDGRSSIGDLILKDPRARILSPTYFARHKKILDQVLPDSESFVISEGGNHCQGAIFRNGKDLITRELLRRVEEVAMRIPDFYFGRLDVRYKDQESFRRGENFEIVEINGASSEATHIWDPRTTLWEAYTVLYRQWSLLFQIGKEVRDAKNPYAKVQVVRLFKDWITLGVRKSPLSVSS